MGSRLMELLAAVLERLDLMNWWDVLDLKLAMGALMEGHCLKPALAVQWCTFSLDFESCTSLSYLELPYFSQSFLYQVSQVVDRVAAIE